MSGLSNPDSQITDYPEERLKTRVGGVLSNAGLLIRGQQGRGRVSP